MDKIIKDFFGLFKDDQKESSKNHELSYDLEKIQKILDFRRNALIPLIIKSNMYPDPYQTCKLIDNIFEKWTENLKKKWINGKKVVAFLGRYSSGKSSLLNTILEDNDLLGVDDVPTTAISSYISYGLNKKICLVDNDDNLIHLPEDLFRQLKREVIEEIPIRKLIKHFVIEHYSPVLDGFSLLDTPGYDSLDKEDKNHILKVLKEADHVFWVIDINDGDISQDALKFIKEHLTNIYLSIVVSKADRKSPTEQEKVRQKIENSFKKAQIPFIECILYSTKKNTYSGPLTNLKITQRNYKQELIAFLTELIEYCTEQILKLKENINKDENHLDDSIKEIESCKGFFDKITKYHYVRNGFWGDYVITDSQWNALYSDLCSTSYKYGFNARTKIVCEHSLDQNKSELNHYTEIRELAKNVHNKLIEL